ncbi:hypothetical protein W02_35430 [Nitrospira sp. KM1]|uniref:hypothetical protein n=1 Tax=Nitrospira sp. KM1 TaxID=1936990 RepID=UPI0013A7578C|nr:hypothetical protein [Nitrospira sp. KM1]BCA56403.1 hypothetical protein W02_35430 [Nitrospira sp. KM1]
MNRSTRIIHRLPAVKTLFLCLVLAACAGPKYVPEITVSSSGPIIDATAEFHDLYPTFDLLSGKVTFGIDTPDAEKTEPGVLTDQIGTEIIKAMAAAGVFMRVTRFDPHPDVILSGRIVALNEHVRPQFWTKVPVPAFATVAQMLQFKTHVTSGEAHLIIYVMKPNGTLIGTYTGKSVFKEKFNPTNDVPPGTRLNRALSEAMKQIQEQMVHDAQLRIIASR